MKTLMQWKTIRMVLVFLGMIPLAQGIRAQAPDMTWLNQKDGPRPAYVWENREDYIYHEMWYPDPDKLTAPEIWPIMRCPWVFNRAMRWVEAGNGTMVAFCEGGDLKLTGPSQVSRWYSDPANQLSDSGNALRFVKRTGLRLRDCVVLPSFQFHLGQHPRLRIEVKSASDDWQFVASIKGRSGAPFLSSGWQRGPQTIEFDVAGKLRELGYDLNYAELHFVMGLWPKRADEPAEIEFSAALLARPAIVGCLPVIRTREHAREGVPVSAIATDGAGNRLGKERIQLFALTGGNRTALEESGGIWAGTIRGLPVGNSPVRLVAESGSQGTAPHFEPATLVARITEEDFARYDRDVNAIRLAGKLVKPLTGSFQGTFFFRDVGLPSERMVNNQAEWDQWDRRQPPGEHQHFWESLTPAELGNRFAYLSRNGWDLVHLHLHYGIWERLDAFGHPAPHAAEQLATYVRAASQAGLRVMLALSSYPYSRDTHEWDQGTAPYAQTLELGFQNDDWYHPDREPFNSRYREYLRSTLKLFRDESGIFSFSSSGEGDWKNGPDRFLDTQKVVRSLDPHHLVVSEPVMLYRMLPLLQVSPFPSDLVGNRNYTLGKEIPFERDMGIVYRLNRMVPNMFLAEGSYPSSHLYTSLSANPKPYVGTREYRLHLRDTLYLGLVHRMPLLMTWDEVFTEDERLVLKEVRDLFDWTQPLEEPAVAAVIGDAEAAGHARLGELEAAMIRLPLDYRFISAPAEARPGETVIDARKPLDLKAYSSLDSLPASLRERIPFRLSPGWSSSYCIARGRKSMLAYIYNTIGKVETSFYLGAALQRSPGPASLGLEFLNLPEGTFTLYDLVEKKAVRQGRASSRQGFAVEFTSHDYLLLVRGH